MSEVRPQSPKPRLILALCLPLLALAAPAAVATEVSIFRQDERSEALDGEAEGTSVGADGELRLAPRFERLAGVDEPFLFAAARHPDGGAVLGTGAEGKVFRIDAAGVPTALGAVDASSVFALHVLGDGTVLAAGSPGGAVVRFAAGSEAPATVFDPEATYIWDLATDRDGRVLVATGLPGRVYRLSADFSSAELIYDSADRHVRTLLPRADGSLLVGTAGQGLIVEIDAAGQERTLYDAAEPEVLAFAERGGVLYAALLASEASQVDLSATAAAAGGGEAADGQGTTVGSRAASYDGPRSRLLALEDGRSPRSVAELKDETVHALATVDGRLWLGTGQQGALYRLEREELILEHRFEESQVIELLAPDGGRAEMLIATTDSVALHRFAGDRVERGTFLSQVFDAEHAARFGVLRWWGEPAGGAVRFEVRAGMAQEPDATWSDWRALEAGGAGVDLELPAAVGVARYVQWRAVLEAGADGGPRVDAVELSYKQLNQAPRITSLEVLDPGEILVPQSFNAASTTFEPWSPNRDGIFTRLRPERSDGQTKTLWKRGYRSLRFAAEDPNDDALRYRLEVRPVSVGEADSEGDGAGDDRAGDDRAGDDRADDDRADDDRTGGGWLEVADDLEESWLSFDSTVLPDGVYRFRLTASDGGANPRGGGLEDRRRSEPVIVDHTPPRLVSAERQGERLRLEVADALQPIRAAVLSVDAGPWRPVEAVDGLLDARREQLEVTAPQDARMVLLRLTDAALNVVTLAVETP